MYYFMQYVITDYISVIYEEIRNWLILIMRKCLFIAPYVWESWPPFWMYDTFCFILKCLLGETISV